MSAQKMLKCSSSIIGGRFLQKNQIGVISSETEVQFIVCDDDIMVIRRSNAHEKLSFIMGLIHHKRALLLALANEYLSKHTLPRNGIGLNSNDELVTSIKEWVKSINNITKVDFIDATVLHELRKVAKLHPTKIFSFIIPVSHYKPLLVFQLQHDMIFLSRPPSD